MGAGIYMGGRDKIITYFLVAQWLLVIAVLMFCMVVAMGSEIIQPMVSPLRNGSIGDGVADITGLFLGLVLFAVLKSFYAGRW